jgi:hypothetical protein
VDESQQESSVVRYNSDIAKRRIQKHASSTLPTKMTHRWKSAKNADSHTMLGKASHKTATLSHISNSPGDGFLSNAISFGWFAMPNDLH